LLRGVTRCSGSVCLRSTTEGVVTAVYQTGGFNGFYLETGGAGGTAADDRTPGASDAVFVFGAASVQQVGIGESVTVTGQVAEFQGETEIEFPTVTESATALPAVAPTRSRGRTWRPTRRRRRTRASFRATG